METNCVFPFAFARFSSFYLDSRTINSLNLELLDCDCTALGESIFHVFDSDITAEFYQSLFPIRL